MLANIMTTPLDIGPLKECGVSHNCINLIAKMLNPDPLLRPDELECLRHPWLVDSASAGEMGLDDNNVGLGEIQEEDDLGLGASRQNESDDACDVADSNVSEIIEVDEIDHEDPRQSKRARIDGAFAPRDQAQLSSSPEVLYPSLPAIDTQQSTEIHTGSAAYNTRLFGEIGASALRSSGVLGYDAQAALQISTQSNRDARASASNSGHHLRIATTCNVNQRQATNDDLGQHQLQYPHPLSLPDTQAGPAPSLLGAEALVGQLNMASPESAKSAFSAPNTPKTPTTPKTRESSPISGLAGSKRSSQEANNENAETTPKRRHKFENFADRMIRLDLPPSYYYGRDRSTHNLEYASAVSGRDYVGEAKAAFAILQAERNGDKTTEQVTRRPDGTKPWTMNKGWEKDPIVMKTLFGHGTGDNKNKSPVVESNSTSKATSATDIQGTILKTQIKEFVKPPPRLGKLTTVPGSFVDLTLKIDQRLTRWGRAFDSTIVYTQNLDTRVPKNAFDIMFWGPRMESRIKEGGDWMEEENSWAIISTRTSFFIRVNGVMLTRFAPDHSGWLYGKLYTGDIVSIFEDEKEFLKFKCEFFHSKSVGPRPANEQKFVVEKETEKYLIHLRKSSELASAAAASAAASASNKA